MNERLWSTRSTRASRSRRPPKGSTRRPKSCAAERRGHGVDREVPAVEVLAEPRALDGRQRARSVVELGPGGDDVDPLALAVRDDRSPELVMWRRATAEDPRERVREGDRVALHRDVDVEALLAEQDVPDRAADEVDAVGEIRGAGDRVDDGCEARRGAQLVCDPGRGLVTGTDVAPSSSRRRSVRLTTPTSSLSRRIATRPSSAAVTSARSSMSGVCSSAVTTLLLMIPRTGACARSWLTALSRSSRPTLPTRRPSSTTNTPLWPWRWQSVIASRTLAPGSTARAGADMTSRAVRVLPGVVASASTTRARAESRSERAIADAACACPPPPNTPATVAASIVVRTAADDDEDALVHLDQEDERPCVGEVDDLVREVRDAVDVLRPLHGRDENLLAVRRDGLQAFHQRVQQAPARRRRAARAGTRSRDPGGPRGGSTTKARRRRAASSSRT